LLPCRPAFLHRAFHGPGAGRLAEDAGDRLRFTWAICPIENRAHLKALII
jgi:hypothetical protein